MRHLEFNLTDSGTALIGVEPITATYSLYLGAAPCETGNITAALRSFGLPNAVAPGEWPNPHEGVTTDDDPRHRGN